MNFSDGMKGMCETLAQSRSDREKVMRELHNAHSRDRMECKSTIKRISGDVKRLFGDVHVLVQHFHGDRGKMGKEMHQALGEFIANTQRETEGILKESRTFLKGFRGEHKRMAEELHQILEGYAQRIHREVGQMRKSFQQTQKALHADFQKARGFWMEFAHGLHRTKAVPRAKASGLRARIMAALKGSSEGMTMKELSYAIGMSEKPLNRTLMRMRRQKEIRKRKNIFCTA